MIKTDNYCASNGKMKICFGYSTALEILRSVDASKLVFARKNQLCIPEKIPSSQEVIVAMRKVGAEYPSLRVKSPFHILVNEPKKCYSINLFISHAFKKTLKYGFLQRLSDSVFVSSPSFIFLQIASQEKDFMALLQFGFELCGTYQTKRTSTTPAYQVPPLASVQTLRDFVDRNPTLYGIKKARKALSYIADGSASPLETKLALTLGLPMSYGGYGLEIPRMNYEIETNSAAYGISGRKHLRCDLCWPKEKLDVEYQSREMHEGELSRARDSRRTNALAAMGWKCINVTNDEVASRYAMDTIAETIRKHLGKRCRITVSDYHSKKLKLRRQLGLFIGNE